MFTFLVVLILIISSLLILAVLAQNSKKEGLGGATFGSNMGASQLMGVQKTSDLLEQITWGLVIALFVFTLATSVFITKIDQPGTFSTSPNITRAQERSTLLDATAQDDDPDPSDQPTTDK